MQDKLQFSGTATAEQSGERQSAAQVYDELTELTRRAEQAKSRRERSSSKTYLAAVAALSAAVIFLSAALIVCAIGWSREQGTIVPQIVEVEKEILVPDYIPIDPSVEYERVLGEDGFLLNDSSYGPIRIPILQGVAKNELIYDLFSKDEQTGYMTYSGPEEYMAGIDVSVYQGEIDWRAVKDSGIDFVMIRCGNRGYVTGLLAEDANFKMNIRGAIDAGLKVGVYYFSQALTEEEALEEANFVAELLEDYDVTFPVAYDWEVVNDPDGDTARTAYIDPEQLTNNFLVFAQRLELEGYTPVLYANKKTTVWKYDLARLQGYDLWYAEYNDIPSLPYKWQMWQYSSKGSVDGINGSVDLNICFKDYSAEE